MKNIIRKALPIALFILVFIVFISGVFYYYLTGQPEPISTEEINAVLVSQDLHPVDVTSSVLGNFSGAGLINCTVAEQGDIRFEFYNFNNASSALRVYREARKLIVRTKMAYPRTQIEFGKSGYQYYSLSANDDYSVAVYVKNTAIYAYCKSENQSKIIDILDEIGYVNAESERETPYLVMALTRVIPFAFYILMGLVARNFIWRAAYKSAGVTNKNIDSKEKKKKELFLWFVEKSSNPKTTSLFLLIYRFILLPEFISLALAVIGCFTSQLDDWLNIVGVIIPLLLFVVGMIGAIAEKRYNRKR